MHMNLGVSELLCNGRVRVIFLLLLMPLPAVLGWGKEGHYAICKITQEYLTEDALFAVKQLLPDSAEGDLAAVCSWADEVRHNYHYRWSSALHYVDTPDYRCNYEYCNEIVVVNIIAYLDCSISYKYLMVLIGDCHDSYGHKHRCVTGAIYNYTIQLKSADADTSSELNYNLTEALMFLSHFVGDVHQPLHVGFTGDLGGNSITVRWYRRKTNLHHVWDNMIIESALKTFYGSDLSIMIQAIQRNITDIWSTDVSIWEHCAHNYTACPDRYASESISLACKFAYKNATPGSTLEDDYFLSRLPIVEKRLAQGGVRLAAILNRIFTPKTRIAQA
ncbi:endonuclease 4-like isoform X1 [Gastrolobium bilobum]|uniref:endonuclease 4-like isoform X1 n=1 Tax=Gastrolobium bilobum TaxID=150636 RepID=UPI002AB18442|nr:endonuclease 4-like isoform X1 [Gastrolobium bilobum]